MPLNMKTVIPGRLYRSGRIAPSELAMLAAPPFNIHTIVSLDQATGMAIAPYIKSYGIRQIMVPIFASGSNVRTAATTLAQNLANITSDNGGVLIHCARGMDRTGFAIALYRVKIQGKSCNEAIREAESQGYGTGISKAAKNQFDAAICKACHIAHTHYCQILKSAQQKDIRNLIENERTLEGNPAIAVPPAIDPQQSFAPFADPSSDNEILEADDRKAKMKARLQLLERVLKELLEDSNDMDMPQVGQRNNYNGVADSSLNPPSGADGSVPGSNLSAAPAEGGITQF